VKQNKNSPEDWAASSSAPKVPDFIWAKILAGVVLVVLDDGSGGTGGGEENPLALLNGDGLLNGDWLLLNEGWLLNGD
jgi:hypothetical protein